MEKDAWNKFKEEIMKIHPLERLKKCRDLLQKEKDEEILEELAQIIEETKKLLGIEEITDSNNNLQINATSPSFQLNNSDHEVIDNKIENDVIEIVKETNEKTNYSLAQNNDFSDETEKNLDTSEISRMYKRASQLRSIITESKEFNQYEKEYYEDLKNSFISKLPQFQTQGETNPELKENLLKTEYALRDIQNYTISKKSNTTMW